MADPGSSQNVQAFIGHLLTDTSFRDAVKAASAQDDGHEAIAKTINGQLGTALTSADALEVLKEAKARLGALKAAPETVADAHDNALANYMGLGPPY